MKFYYNSKYINLVKDKKDNVYIDDLNLDNYLKILNIFNKDIYEAELKKIEDIYYKIGLNNLLTHYKLTDNTNITPYIIALLEIEDDAINKLGIKVYKNTQLSINNIVKKENKIYIDNVDSYENIDYDYIFKKYKDVSIIIININEELVVVPSSSYNIKDIKDLEYELINNRFLKISKNNNDWDKIIESLNNIEIENNNKILKIKKTIDDLNLSNEFIDYIYELILQDDSKKNKNTIEYICDKILKTNINKSQKIKFENILKIKEESLEI